MGLLDGITEQQEEKRNVVFDLDSQIYLSAYRFKDTEDIELIYADVWMRIKSIEIELWKKFKVEDVILAITSKKNFRHSLTDKWKANRKSKPENELTEKQLESQRSAEKLKLLVSDTKRLLATRMTKSSNYRVVVNNIAEADDTFVDFVNNKDYIGVTIDSDCLMQSKNECFNPKKWNWTESNDYTSICRHILIESIAGTHNGAGFGVKGIGLVKATKLIDDGITFDEFTNLFETPEDMLMNVRVISCGQVTDGKLELLDVLDVANMIEEINQSGDDVF